MVVFRVTVPEGQTAPQDPKSDEANAYLHSGDYGCVLELTHNHGTGLSRALAAFSPTPFVSKRVHYFTAYFLFELLESHLYLQAFVVIGTRV